MTAELVYLYNLLLLMLYAMALTVSLLHFLREKRRSLRILYGLLALYFLIFILDNSLISMTEVISSFATRYNQAFQGTSFIKTSVFLISNVCQLQLITRIGGKKGKWWDYLLLLGIFAFMLFPAGNSPALRSYLYYLPNQIWLFYLGWRAAIYAGQSDVDSMRRKYLRVIAGLALAFSLLILIEDSIVIFHVDQYSSEHSRIVNRSFSENFLSVGLCLTAVYYFLRDAALLTAGTEAAASPDLRQIFCEQHHLTEREKEVCQLLLEGQNNQAIADSLYLSVGTVKTHIHNIFIKTEVRKREELFSLYQDFLNQHS